MSTTILATKLYIPPPRPKVVLRPHLIERLNEGLSLRHKLTLISASAGFGKTTLVSEWVANCGQPVVWLSLDEGDNAPTHFLIYFVAVLQTIAQSKVAGVATKLGAGVLGALQSPQESVLKFRHPTLWGNRVIGRGKRGCTRIKLFWLSRLERD